MYKFLQIAITWVIFIVITNVNGFGYSKKEQHLWAKEYKSCAGKLQSPVSISTNKATPWPLPALEMIGYHDFLPMPQTLTNTGQTVKLTINKNAIYRNLPYVFGAMLERNQRYEMEQLHFHWGKRNNRGAEHVLNGVRYPMEMHIVHRNIAYENFSYALQHKDGVVVLAVFFQLQEEHNELLQPFMNRLSDVQWANTEISINISISLMSLLPLNTDIFYTYKGSLTTPPCSEVVTWIIFATPVSISSRQMGKFQMLSNGEDILADNFRHLQNIGQRKIYTRRTYVWLFSKYNHSQLSFADLDWFWS